MFALSMLNCLTMAGGEAEHLSEAPAQPQVEEGSGSDSE